MFVDHLVLAGGGHSHALILMRWAMKPHMKPKGLITLINRNSTTIYSGMFPGLLSGNYQLREVLIDLRLLADKAGVSFVVGEISSLDLCRNKISVEGRIPPLGFSKISIDVGSDNRINEDHLLTVQDKDFVFPIRPFRKSFEWINFIVIGINSLEQLKKINKMNSKKKLNFNQRSFVVSKMKDIANNRILLPYKWKHNI